MMNDREYFERFFDEKEIAYTVFSIEDRAGNVHLIGSDTVIELIKAAPAREQVKIRKHLVGLDFTNQPIAPYLRFLAECYVLTLEDQNAKTVDASLN